VNGSIDHIPPVSYLFEVGREGGREGGRAGYVVDLLRASASLFDFCVIRSPSGMRETTTKLFMSYLHPLNLVHPSLPPSLPPDLPRGGLPS